MRTEQNIQTNGTAIGATVNIPQSPVRPTTFVQAPRLSNKLGVNIVIASETFQCTGSFKFRAAYHLVRSAPEELFITASSGNFGQALAYAASLLGKSSIVAMPAASAKVKIEGVREFGGIVELVDTRIKSRMERLKELASQYPQAYVTTPYDDPLIIEGNSSLGREIGELKQPPDVVVAPVGGGGLIAGVVKGLAAFKHSIEVCGAEPLLGNDAARSLKAGKIVCNDAEPATIADGARNLCLGKNTWEIVHTGVKRIFEVSEEKIAEAVRLLFSLANLKVEPTGALSLAAVMSFPASFAGRSVCCIVSGGNVDPLLYGSLLAQ